jgi:hypothetical protein
LDSFPQVSADLLGRMAAELMVCRDQSVAVWHLGVMPVISG